MSLILQAPWIVVAGPFVIALVVGLLGARGRVAAPWLAAIGPLSVIWLSASATVATVGTTAVAQPWTSGLASSGKIAWFTQRGASLQLGWAIDSLTALLLGVVGVVALCVVIFSIGYMAEDPGWNRYFALLSVFTGSMSLLVIADSFLTLFVGWELVGACSYLLIGFWYGKPSAARAAVKAFLTTRVGDVGLLLGVGILWSSLGTLGYRAVMAQIGTLPTGPLEAAAVCIAIGAIGKSAQFPLHAWLPDAMEGPTPVSALIHAATMVAAGVFLIVRVWPIFALAPAARDVVLIAGAISGLGAALAAVPQRDIKKVLAYSTVSQLGFMFAALGAGAWEAAFFHLMTHAAFKGLLFLASGSVIHGSGTQDLHEMGGLRSAMPVTFTTWCVGALALAGIPGFAGFFSKDAVLEAVLHEAPVAGWALLGASLLTAFYMARATRLAFLGSSRSEAHAHESPGSMLGPLVVLAIPSLALGWFAPQVSAGLGAEAEPLALGVSALAVAAALVGGFFGWRAGRDAESDAAFSRGLGPAGTALRTAFGWDSFVDRLVVRPVVTGSRVLWAWGDKLVADGAVEGLGGLAGVIGRRLSGLQSGDAQSYALAIVVGIALMLAAAAVGGR